MNYEEVWAQATYNSQPQPLANETTGTTSEIVKHNKKEEKQEDKKNCHFKIEMMVTSITTSMTN